MLNSPVFPGLVQGLLRPASDHSGGIQEAFRRSESSQLPCAVVAALASQMTQLLILTLIWRKLIYAAGIYDLLVTNPELPLYVVDVPGNQLLYSHTEFCLHHNTPVQRLHHCTDQSQYSVLLPGVGTPVGWESWS